MKNILKLFCSSISLSIVFASVLFNIQVSNAQESFGVPLRIKIPSLSVDAPIDSVGLLADGSMGVPTIPANGAWYKFGAKPGEVGSAVIAGHLNWWNGAKGVFEDLDTLKAGDLVTITDDKGRLITFAVRKTQIYTAQANATDVFSSTDGKAHLNLVTCEGSWIKSQQQYNERLVVFTDRVENTTSDAITTKVSGRILLQVEQNGEAWYVNPVDGFRYYMKDGATAYQMMRKFGLGITDADLARVQKGDLNLINRLRGRILLQVQQRGEAYYVHPDTGIAHYMKNGDTAYILMRYFSLGITDADLTTVPIGTTFN